VVELIISDCHQARLTQEARASHRSPTPRAAGTLRGPSFAQPDAQAFRAIGSPCDFFVTPSNSERWPLGRVNLMQGLREITRRAAREPADQPHHRR
jgi:hypothetical protein